MRNLATTPRLDRRADNRTMVHISVATRNSITQSRFNLIGQSAHQLTLAFQEEHFCCHCKGMQRDLHVYLKIAFFTSRNSILYLFLRWNVNIKMATKELMPPFAMATEMFLLKSQCQLICWLSNEVELRSTYGIPRGDGNVYHRHVVGTAIDSWCCGRLRSKSRTSVPP